MVYNTQPPPNQPKVPTSQIWKSLMDTNLWEHAYDITISKAIRCPCSSSPERSDNLVGCNNCQGLGWIWINPTTSKALISSINKNTQFKEWSEELMGTISISLIADTIEQKSNRIAFMDKITIENNSSIFSELKRIRTSAELTPQKFVFLSYPVLSVEDVFLFDSQTDPLIRLAASEYSLSTVNEYVLKISKTLAVDSNGTASIRYKHKLEYVVIDIPHDVRQTILIDHEGRKQKQLLPVQAIGRKLHQYFAVPNYDGTGVISNNY